MSGSSVSSQTAYGMPGAHSAIRRRPGLFLVLASLPLVLVLAGSLVFAVVSGVLLSPFGVDVAVFGSAASAIAVPTLLAVVSALRPWWTAVLLGVSYVATISLVDVGGGSAWLWISAFWTMWLLSLTALLLNRWARVSTLMSTAVAAVGLVSFFAGGAVLTPSLQLAAVSLLFCVATVVVASFIPVGLFAGAAARARYTKEEAPVGEAAETGVRLSWRGKHKAECAVADVLSGLPPKFRVFHSVEVSDNVLPVDHLVCGPTGITVIAVTSAPAGALSDRMKQVLGLVAQQREAVAAALGLGSGKVFGLVVSVPQGETDALPARGLFAVRPTEGEGEAVTVPATSLSGLSGELDTPFTVFRDKDVDMLAAKVRMKFRPARVLLPRSERVKSSFQVGAVSPDGEVTWEYSAMAQFRDGAAVALMTPSGLVPGFRVVAPPAVRDGVMAALVCYEEDYFAGGQARQSQVFAYPLAAIRPESD